MEHLGAGSLGHASGVDLGETQSQRAHMRNRCFLDACSSRAGKEDEEDRSGISRAATTIDDTGDLHSLICRGVPRSDLILKLDHVRPIKRDMRARTI